MTVHLKQQIKSTTRQPIRTMLAAFLMLCLLLPCSLKKELQSDFLKNGLVGKSSSSHKHPKSVAYLVDQTNIEAACNTAAYSLLSATAVNPLLQPIDLTNPFLLLATTLASLYLFLLYQKGKIGSHPAFPGNVLTKDIPLFLFLRKLLI